MDERGLSATCVHKVCVREREFVCVLEGARLLCSKCWPPRPFTYKQSVEVSIFGF